MTPLEYFRLLAPEFECVSDASANQWITISSNIINTGCMDDELASMALALYSAHMLSIRNIDSTSMALGNIISEKEGDLERTYGSLKGSDTYLGQTRYGQQYLDVTRACFGSTIMTRGAGYGCC